MPCAKRATFLYRNSGCHSVWFGVLGRNMPMSLFFSIAFLRFKHTGIYRISTEEPAGNNKAGESSKISFEEANYPISSCRLRNPSYFLCRPSLLSSIRPHPTLHPQCPSRRVLPHCWGWGWGRDARRQLVRQCESGL